MGNKEYPSMIIYCNELRSNQLVYLRWLILIKKLHTKILNPLLKLSPSFVSCERLVPLVRLFFHLRADNQEGSGPAAPAWRRGLPQPYLKPGVHCGRLFEEHSG